MTPGKRDVSPISRETAVSDQSDRKTLRLTSERKGSAVENPSTGMLYELRPFDENGCELPAIERRAKYDASIIGQAGTIAKANNGPVDIARVGLEPWAHRYITTASPSEFHAKGYRTERLT